VIEIKRNKTLFIDYSKNKTLKRIIETEELEVNFSFSGVQLKNDSVYSKLFLVTEQSSWTWSMFVSVAWRTKEFPLYINIPLKKENIDIRPNISFTRLQSKPLTCESSATADALSYLLWKNISEKSVFSLLPKSSYYNKLPISWSGKIFWWNPNEGFVWYEDFFKQWKEVVLPKQSKMTWYWVYEAPLSAMIQENFLLDTKIINESIYTQNFWEKEHLKEILKTIKDGNMVILWADRCTDPIYDDGIKKSKWAIRENNLHLKYNAKNTCEDFSASRKLFWYYEKDWEITQHRGLSGEHAFYLLWFSWTLEKPEKIRVWDTDTWYHEYPLIEWLRKWNMMDNRSLIIYKK
jgi:hypothetical protein